MTFYDPTRNPTDLTFQPIGSHQSRNDLASVRTLTDSAPAGATKLYIQALTQNVAVTLDGSTPSSTVGFQLVAGHPLVMILISSDTTVKVKEVAATAVLQYQWGA